MEVSKYDVSDATLDADLGAKAEKVSKDAQVTLLEAHLCQSFKTYGDERTERVRYYVLMFGKAPKSQIHPALWAEAQRCLGKTPTKDGASGSIEPAPLSAS